MIKEDGVKEDNNEYSENKKKEVKIKVESRRLSRRELDKIFLKLQNEKIEIQHENDKLRNVSEQLDIKIETKNMILKRHSERIKIQQAMDKLKNASEQLDSKIEINRKKSAQIHKEIEDMKIVTQKLMQALQQEENEIKDMKGTLQAIKIEAEFIWQLKQVKKDSGNGNSH